jgi:acyl-CoA thioesterase-1
MFSLLLGAPLQAESAFAQDRAKGGEIVILALGDSLTAGYGLPEDKSFPAQLEQALRAEGRNVRVINAGVSGDTAEDGLARLDWSLSEPVDAAIVELGANNALRGIPADATESALDKILGKLKARGIPVLLAGMEAPRNWSAAYISAFHAIYPHLAKKYDAILYPFFLKDVVGRPKLNLEDGLHPTAEGVAIIVRNMLPQVEELIDKAKAKAAQQIAN